MYTDVGKLNVSQSIYRYRVIFYVNWDNEEKTALVGVVLFYVFFFYFILVGQYSDS